MDKGARTGSDPRSRQEAAAFVESAITTLDETRGNVEGHWHISIHQPDGLKIQGHAELQELLQPFGPIVNTLEADVGMPEGPLCRSPPAASLLPEQRRQPKRDISMDSTVEGVQMRICTSDILLQGAYHKRPRLLPPHLKMYTDVPPCAVESSAEERQQKALESRFLPESVQLLDSMSPMKPTDIALVESLHRHFRSLHRRSHRPPLSQAESQQLIITPFASSVQKIPQENLPPKKRFLRMLATPSETA